MVNVEFRKFKEQLPEIGRSVIVWSDRNASFDQHYIGQQCGIAKLREYETDDEYKDCFSIGNMFVEKDGEIDLEDYWTYSDDIYAMFYDYFYEDWLWYCKNGMASLKCKMASSFDDGKVKKVFVDYIFKYNNEVWEIHCVGRSVYGVKKV